MTLQSITLNVPEQLYQQLRRAAESRQRSVNDLLVEAITAAAPAMATNTSELRTALANMTYLNDAALWQAARATLTPKQRETLEMLHHKQQRETLSATEAQEMKALETLYRDTLLVRAQAAVLLQQRHYDISDASQFAPIE
ncbi:MAG: hypothetical protein IAE79_25190 [Anaerolinea sp.]|nr:hypothetical protein [Anaerolinea sp.]